MPSPRIPPSGFQSDPFEPNALPPIPEDLPFSLASAMQQLAAARQANEFYGMEPDLAPYWEAGGTSADISWAPAAPSRNSYKLVPTMAAAEAALQVGELPLVWQGGRPPSFHELAQMQEQQWEGPARNFQRDDRTGLAGFAPAAEQRQALEALHAAMSRRR